MSDTHPCQSLTSLALDYARSLSCAAIEVAVEKRDTRVATWERDAGAVSREPVEKTNMTILAYLRGGRCGRASGGVGTDASVRRMVDLAVERAGAATASATAGPAARYPQNDQGLGLFDRRQRQLTDETRESVVNENLDDIHAHAGVEALSFQYEEELVHRRIVNSGGLEQDEVSTRYSLLGRVKHKEHVIEQCVQSRHFADVASLPLGADMAAQILRYSSPKTRDAGPVLVVIEPRVIAKLMSAVAPAFDRGWVEAGKSFIREGRRVGSEKLHMVDDALQFGGLQSRAFDDRGVPALDLPLIREGVVGALYMTVEQARVQDARPSGHEGSTALWPGNLLLRCGTRSRNMIFPELGEFVLLDDLVVDEQPWFNLKSGSLKLKGHFFESHSGSKPEYIGVRTIRTTFTDLWSSIQEIANDQQRFGFVDVSTWIVDGLTLDG